MKKTLRKWTAVAVVLVAVLGASAAFGEERGACYEAYLESGLTAQQVSFDQFHKLYGDSFCAPVGDGLQATHGARVPGGTR